MNRIAACPDCGHPHTPDGCAGDPTPSDLWAGVSPAACDCDSAQPTAEKDALLDWEVFDMAHDHRLCLNENHPAEFGPMSEAAARAMQQSNPRGYWARKIPRPTPPGRTQP